MAKSLFRIFNKYKKLVEYHKFVRNYIIKLQEWGKEKTNNKKNLIERNCPVCKTYNNSNIAFRAPIYNFIRCTKCELIFANKVLNDIDLKKFYENNEIYQSCWAKNSEIPSTETDNSPYKHIIDTILKYRNGNGTYLEIGPGTGGLLRELAAYFEKVECVELNEMFVKRFVKDLRVKVYQKPLEELRLPANSYDVVVLDQVIEHLNSLDLFKNIFEILKPGGIVYVGCPYADSLSMKVFKQKHTHLSTHGHVNMFNKKSIEFFANKYKFNLKQNNISNMLDINTIDLICSSSKNFMHRYSYHPIFLPISLIITKISRYLLEKSHLISLLGAGSYLEIVFEKPKEK